MTDIVQPQTKEEKLAAVKAYFDHEGFSVDDLAEFQQTRHEPQNEEEAAGPSPSEIEGVAFDLTHAQLNAYVAELGRRVAKLESK